MKVRATTRLTAAAVLALTPLTALGTEQILFPAYESPDDGTNYWQTLAGSVSAQVPITMILNPDSGPTTDDESFYKSFIPTFQSNGGRVIGYVDSDTNPTSGNPVMKTVAQMESEVDQYAMMYPGINGIFVDDFNYSSSSTVGSYKSLYGYIHTKYSNWRVYVNPGTPIDASYQPTADVFVTFESTSNAYKNYSPSAWQANYPASDFGNIAYSEPSAAALATDFQRAQTDRAGYVYFTNFPGGTAYQNIPANWSTELADVATANAATPTVATYLPVNSSAFAMADNWSTAVPNGIGAEADFTGALNGSAAVTVSTPLTLGKITFNNSSFGFTLSGSSSLLMQQSGGSAIIDAQAGAHTIALPINIASPSVFQAESGASLTVSGAVTVLTGASLSTTGAVQFQSSATVQAGGVLQLSAGFVLTGLTLNGTSRTTLNAQTATPVIALETAGLSIATGSTLDLSNGELIINNGALATINSEIRSAYSNGAWTGAGITSSSAAAGSAHLTALGVIQNSATGNPAGQAIYGSFGGDATVNTDVLVRYTYYGDANLDGKVDGSDYSLIDNGYAHHLTGWFNGDFNYDGVVDGSDYALIDNAFNSQQAAGLSSQIVAAPDTGLAVAAVPEPAGLAAMMLMAAFSNRARRRRCGVCLPAFSGLLWYRPEPDTFCAADISNEGP